MTRRPKPVASIGVWRQIASSLGLEMEVDLGISVAGDKKREEAKRKREEAQKAVTAWKKKTREVHDRRMKAYTGFLKGHHWRTRSRTT